MLGIGTPLGKRTGLRPIWSAENVGMAVVIVLCRSAGRGVQEAAKYYNDRFKTLSNAIRAAGHLVAVIDRPEGTH